MKRTIFLAAALSLFALGTQAQAEGRLRFGVMSDIHVGSGMGQGWDVKVPLGLKNITSHGALDALAFAGDLTDNGSENYFKHLVAVLGNPDNFKAPTGPLLLMMGNHDNISPGAKDFYMEYLRPFNNGEPYPMHTYRTIKGYPFITLSMMTSDVHNGYPIETKQWLEEQLKAAAAECPGKPIFVFTHIPADKTCYSTWADFENGSTWGQAELNAILNRYPQVVLFGGHSHYPLGDPRSIHQGISPSSPCLNYFTCVGTGSTTYSEIHPGAVDKGIHPEAYQDVIEALIVEEMENGDIQILRYNTYHNEEIGADQRWVIRAPFDGSMFQYADKRDAAYAPKGATYHTGLPAPVFANGAKPTAEVQPYGFKLTIPQATDNECVFRYGVKVIDSNTGSIVSESYVFSQFYLNSAMPKSVDCMVDGLEPEQSYQVEVIAYDSYDNTSAPLTISVSTPADNNPADNIPEAFNRWDFNNPKKLLAATNAKKSALKPVRLIANGTAKASASELGIESIDGPTAENLAIRLPKDAAFMAMLENTLPANSYTIQMDIRVPSNEGYNALLQTTPGNTDDADLFLHGRSIGSGTMGYAGNIPAGKWMRIIIVNNNGKLSLYKDCAFIASKTHSRWDIQPSGFLLFGDEDGERQEIHIAEITLWDQPFTIGQVRRLGKIKVQ